MMAFLGAVVVCLGLLIANSFLDEIGPYTLWGMGYGIAATTLLVAVFLYALRRRSARIVSKLSLGRARTWLYFHIYGGALFLLLLLMHTGFRFPTGILARLMWFLSLWTVLTGLAGLALQRWIPRALASGLSIEVLYDRVPDLIEEIRRKAEALAATCAEPIQTFYAKNMAHTLEGPDRRWIYYLDITGGVQARLRRFDYLRDFLSSEDQSKLGELQRLYKTKLEIDAHYTLQRLLRTWLYAHVPAAVMLLALVALHIFTVFYY